MGAIGFVAVNVDTYVAKGWIFFFLISFPSLTAVMVMCKAVLVSRWSPCTAEGWVPLCWGA